jgi:serine protease inhibitor
MSAAAMAIGLALAMGASEPEPFATASNAFGWSLFRKVAAEAKGPNVVVSPLSVSLALDMTLAGARGATHDEMRRTLCLGDLDDASIHAAAESAMRALGAADPAVTMNVANSLWLRRGFDARPEFLDVNAKRYRAEIRALDFASPDASKTINAWVERATSGKIPKIVPETIDASVVLYLIDAIYFKGRWATPFDPKLTKDDVFHRADGSTVPCKLMQRSGSLACVETSELQAVDLAYGNGAFRMTVLLPAAGSSTDALVAKLDAVPWSDVRERPGDLALPRFVARFEATLNGPLVALGMPKAFSPDADFSGIAGGPLFVSEVKHETFVEVNEEGTEAAAATSVAVARSSAMPSKRFVMRVDRPFVFVIREAKSGIVLFAGKIGDPTADH